MRGQVLGVDRRTGEGMVAGEDGQRYAFRPDDWALSSEPAVGLQVDFEAQDRRATSIFPMPAAPGTAVAAVPAAVAPAPVANGRSRIVAALLALFFGTLGIHRFYLGRNGSGVLMLVLSITVIGLFVTAPWALIDAIRYLLMSDEDFAARYAR